MIKQNLPNLKIHKLTQAQYDRELEAGNIDENALYLTPDDGKDDVISIEDGGTGATTSREAEFNISGDIIEYNTSMSDNSQIVCKHQEPNASTGTFFYRTAGTLWSYIAGKIRSVFGFTSKNVLPVANGGTGETSIANLRKALGISTWVVARNSVTADLIGGENSTGTCIYELWNDGTLECWMTVKTDVLPSANAGQNMLTLTVSIPKTHNGNTLLSNSKSYGVKGSAIVYTTGDSYTKYISLSLGSPINVDPSGTIDHASVFVFGVNVYNNMPNNTAAPYVVMNFKLFVK